MTSYEIAIVGAGIAGSTLASFLAPHAKLILIDRDVRGLPGSTGHAPGFVGQLNSLSILTALARWTVGHYKSVPGGFDTVGGLEIAECEAEVDNLRERASLASKLDLEARLLDAEEATSLAPAFIASATAGLYFPNDGTANAKRLAHAGQDAAVAAGATLLDADVSAITPSDGGYDLSTSRGVVKTRRVVVCTGVWAGQLLPSLSAAAVSVSHPYAYSLPRPQRDKSPFIRWPAAHVYARDHGTRDGIGSYDHDPVHVSSTAMASQQTAYGKWEDGFGGVLDKAIARLPHATQQGFEDRRIPLNMDQVADVPYAFNGLFTVTPDGMPLVGRVSEGMYCAVGVWVTHAAGSARLLADMILEDMGLKGEGFGHELRSHVDPTRFRGRDGKELEQTALSSYNDIYNKDKA